MLCFLIKSDTINLRQADMKSKNVAVTGGAGFIGSNLSRELSKDNHVVIFDDLSSGFLKNIEDITEKNNVEFVKGTINDIDLLQKTFKDVDYVFHQAAIASVVKSIEDPVKSNYVNVNGTLNVLAASKDNKVKKVIQASSSSIYGDTTISPETENILPDPLSPYAVGKLAVNITAWFSMKPIIYQRHHYVIIMFMDQIKIQQVNMPLLFQILLQKF